jgi:hypothetical protein
MTLDEARDHIKDKVIYRDSSGIEEGVITSVNSRYVFVRFGSGTGSKATRPGQLELLSAHTTGGS